jgi:hypothetical protein
MPYTQTYFLDRKPVRKLWKAEARDRVLWTWEGDLGKPLTIKKKTLRHQNAATVALNGEAAARRWQGYDPISKERWARLAAKAKATPKAKPKATPKTKSKAARKTTARK